MPLGSAVNASRNQTCVSRSKHIAISRKYAKVQKYCYSRKDAAMPYRLKSCFLQQCATRMWTAPLLRLNTWSCDKCRAREGSWLLPVPHLIRCNPLSDKALGLISHSSLKHLNLARAEHIVPLHFRRVKRWTRSLLDPVGHFRSPHAALGQFSQLL